MDGLSPKTSSCEPQANTSSRLGSERSTIRSDFERSTSSSGKDSSLIMEWVVGLGLSVLMGLTVRYLVSSIAGLMEMDRLDMEERPTSSAVESRLKNILAKRGQKKVNIPRLSSYELMIAQVVLDPDEIDSSFADIGGLDKTKKEIYELAIMPLVEPDLFQGKLVQPCKGILLYGKPGTGKTMLAKALAKESAAVFIPLQLSNILNKYLGESNKMIAATFTLARKLAPAIIFIDELDTFLKANTTETAYLDTIKSEFLTWWDGIGTRTNSQVLVLGATNKPQAIDPAILRRMPRAFAVPLPDEAGRKAILQLLFKDENLTPEAQEFIPKLARKLHGYSGSDLKELAKAAAMVGVQERTAEFARRRVMGESTLTSREEMQRNHNKPLRAISVQDLEIAMNKVLKTGEAARSYGASFDAENAREQNQTSSDEASLRQAAMLLRAISNLSSGKLNSFRGMDEGDNDDVPNL
ncbi:hypothetical protein ACA910_011296 [Epithemia clementina (nom. ined.)]